MGNVGRVSIILMLLLTAVAVGAPIEVSANETIVIAVVDENDHPVDGACLKGIPAVFGFVCDNIRAEELGVKQSITDQDPAVGMIQFDYWESGMDALPTYEVLPPNGYVVKHPESGTFQVLPLGDGGFYYVAVLTQSTTGFGDRPESAEVECTLVELRPGYPGYRGYVTGIAGAGEAACVEQLEADFPLFSSSEEDRLNLEAANRLGVQGTMDEWVWETWMAIAAERGLFPVCYVCIWTGNDYGPPPTVRISVSPDDPRLQLADVGLHSFVQRYAAGMNIVPQISLIPWLLNDDELRMVAALLTDVDYPTASQLVTTAYQWLDRNFTSSNVDFPYLLTRKLNRGGYYPAAIGMEYADQFYLVDYLHTMDYWKRTGLMLEGYYSAMLATVNNRESQYLLEVSNGFSGSYGEYVRLMEE